MQSSGVQSQFAQRATDPLRLMINSSDHTATQRTQVIHHPLFLNPKLSFNLFYFATLFNSLRLSFSPVPCLYLRQKMPTSSSASVEWPGTARGRTAGYGTRWTRRISCQPLTLLLPIQKISTLPRYSALPPSHLLTRPSLGWTVPPPQRWPIREKVLPWTPATSGIKYLLSNVLWSDGSVFRGYLTGHLLLQSQSRGFGNGQWRGKPGAKSYAFPTFVRCWEKWRQRGNLYTLPCPYLHSQSVCLRMWTHHKSKIPSHTHISTSPYIMRSIVRSLFCFLLYFFSLSRKRVTRGFDCVHIPTLRPKSVCVLLVLPGTTPLQISAPVSKTGTVHSLTLLQI